MTERYHLFDAEATGHALYNGVNAVIQKALYIELWNLTHIQLVLVPHIDVMDKVIGPRSLSQPVK